MREFLKMVSLLWATGPNGRWKEFSKRSDCDGWPTKAKKQNVWKGRHDRTWRGTRAEKRTRK
jgi:hypothetical protein